VTPATRPGRRSKFGLIPVVHRCSKETSMHAWSLVVGLLLVLPPLSLAVTEPAPLVGAKTTPVEPPVAARKPVRLVAHGIERTDDYAWLRADNWREVIRDAAKLPPDIRTHLEAENNYSKAVLAPLAKLRGRLAAEMKGRIQPDDSGVPLPDGPYAYWHKYVPGAEHPQFVRMPRGGGPEEILVDGNELASGKTYFAFGSSRRHSPDHKLYAYTIDESGSESLTLRVRDLASKRDLPDVIEEVSEFAWADSKTLFYTRLDDELRARFVYRHQLGTDPADDPLVYEEKDLQFSVSVERTRTGRFVVISTSTSDTGEQWLIDARRPDSAPVLIEPRTANLMYSVEEWGDQFVIRTNADGTDDFKIVAAPVSSPGRANWRDFIPYQEGRRILSVDAFAGHLVRLERVDGLGRIVIRRKSDGAEHAIALDQEAYGIQFTAPYEYDTTMMRFGYSSLSTPLRTYDYDMETRERALRKEQQVPSGHDPSAYVVRRLFVTTSDNESVPITLLYRKETARDGSAPLFLEGYGAYAFAFPVGFDTNILSLVDRGFVYAIAHVRGGIEKGERWRNAGRRENKPNTFSDFIAVAEYLIRERYTARGRIVARGDSAGGLLMGAVANMRPDLFAGIVARVPFVDALNTMLDETLPLTATDFPEWGDPIRDVAAYRTIAGYSPYDNVRAQAYPSMLVTGGISDPRVQYWEPAKWVAKLRATNTNGARITLSMQMTAGHGGASGRFVELDEAALIAAFALDATGWREPGQ
jgi:oligopeptidase B